MNILVLNREYSPMIGGAAVMTQNLAEEWSRSGHKVNVVTSSYLSANRDEIVRGVHVFRVNTFSRDSLATVWSAGWYLFNGFLRSFNICLKSRPNLINSHFAVPAGIIGVVLSKLFGISHIVTIIGADIYEPERKLSPHKNFFLKLLVRWVLNNSDAVTAISTNIKNAAIKYYNPNKEILVLPVGFKRPEYRTVDRSQLGLDPDTIYICSIGVLLPRKNFRTLIESFAGLKNEKIQLLIIGDGPLRPELETLAEKLGVSDKVNFLGAISDEKKFQYLTNSDIFALVSVHEGFGIVYQEAMFCGPAIIAGSEGGQTDFLVHDRNALLVCPTQLGDISRAIKQLIAEPALRKSLSANARADLEKYYIHNVASQYLNLIHVGQ